MTAANVAVVDRLGHWLCGKPYEMHDREVLRVVFASGAKPRVRTCAVSVHHRVHTAAGRSSAVVLVDEIYLYINKLLRQVLVSGV